MTSYRGFVGFSLLVVLVLGLSACAVRRGTVHEVKEGQTVSTIARVYGVDVDDVLRVNDIRDPKAIRPGTQLVIPGASRTREVPRLYEAEAREGSSNDTSGTAQDPVRRVSRSSPNTDRGANPSPGSNTASRSGTTTDADRSRESTRSRDGSVASGTESRSLPVESSSFQPRWPCTGTVISRFEPDGPRAQHGILVEARQGDLVRAAETGNVKLAGEWDQLPELGKIVIMFHTNHLTTVYAHLKSIRVSEGDRVKQGEPLGEAGQTGEVRRPACYFEIRYRLEPRDPMLFLEEPA